MQSIYLLFLAASTSLAFDYLEPEPRAQPAGYLQHEQAEAEAEQETAKRGSTGIFRCATNRIGPDAVIHKPLDKVDLAGALKQVLDFATAPNCRMDPSSGGRGVFKSSGTTEAQLCNGSPQEMACPTAAEVHEYFEMIQCGTKDLPTMGMAAGINSTIWAYGPAGSLGDCWNAQDSVNAWS